MKKAPALTVRVLRGLHDALTAHQANIECAMEGDYPRAEIENYEKAHAWWRTQAERRGWNAIFPHLKKDRQP